MTHAGPLSTAESQSHRQTDHDEIELDIDGHGCGRFGQTHLARHRMHARIGERRHGGEQHGPLKSSRSGLDDQQDADHADPECCPAPGADVFAQQDRRERGDQQRRDEEDCRCFGQRQCGQGGEVGQIRDHHAKPSKHMGRQTSRSEYPGKALVRGKHGHGNDQCDESAKQHDLMQRQGPAEGLDRDVVDRKRQRAPQRAGNAQPGLVGCRDRSFVHSLDALCAKIQSRSGRSTGRVTRTAFCRDDSPRSSSTARCATPNAEARKRSNSALALPSTGGAPSRIFSRAAAPSPCMPATSVRFAPGCTCSISTTSLPSSRRQAGRVRSGTLGAGNRSEGAAPEHHARAGVVNETASRQRPRASARGASAAAGRRRSGSAATDRECRRAAESGVGSAPGTGMSAR